MNGDSAVDEDFRIALQLQQEEQARSPSKINLRRRAVGANRKYQEGLVIKPSKKLLNEDATKTNIDKPKSRTLNKPLLLSAEMAAVFNDEYSELTRPEVVKKLWEYIKQNDLQDPKDKRFILCDEKLVNLFNRPRINCFKMAKFMSAHLHRKEDLTGATSAQSTKTSSMQSSQIFKTASSPKKPKISNEIVEDSDEDVNEILSVAREDDKKMNPLLLNIPGVSAEMSFTAIQAAVLAYTQAMKLRHASDTDLIIVKPASPISKLMGGQVKDGTIHILDLIHRVHYLFDHKSAE